MTVVLDTRDDFTLENLRRVTVGGEGIEIGPIARRAMEQGRENFMKLLDSDRTRFVYGTTSLPGRAAKVAIPPEQQRQRARQWGRVSGRGYGGRMLDDRLVRGIVFARLMNYVSGTGKVRPIVAERVAALLERPMRPLPSDGQVGAGEILPLFHVLRDVRRDDLEEGEAMALINGSPCAAALVADAALHARHRLEHAGAIFALSIEAFAAPLEAYDEALGDLWGDEDDAAGLQAVRTYLEGADPVGRLFHQAPVSYRIVGRVLGQVRRSVAAVEKAARVSLRSVTDNPVYVPPDDDHPFGRVFSTGGYHNGMATPALDGLSAAWADLAFIAERHTAALNSPETSGIPQHGAGLYGWVVSGFAEEARSAAAPTLSPAAVNDPQNDIASVTFRAYQSERRAAECLDNALVGLGLVASQALFATGRDPAPPLLSLLAGLRSVFPVIGDIDDRDLDADAERLAAVFHAGALSGELDFAGAADGQRSEP
jgi:histidine ammonia-lyase